jgi:hypothetical protein
VLKGESPALTLNIEVLEIVIIVMMRTIEPPEIVDIPMKAVAFLFSIQREQSLGIVSEDCAVLKS